MRKYLCIAALASFGAGVSLMNGCGSSDDSTASGTDAGGTDASLGSDSPVSTMPTPTNEDSGPNDAGTVMTDDGPAPVTAAVACADNAKARCLLIDSCSDNTGNLRTYGSEAACEARLTTQCITNLTAMGTGATPTTVETCAEAYPSEACLAYLSGTPPTACLPPMGTLANGAGCTLSAQCASAWCAVPKAALCGVCAPTPKSGDSCVVTADCGGQNGLACLNNICTNYADAGAACDADTVCDPGFICTGADGGQTCQAQGAAVGATCDNKRVTAPNCDPTLGLACVSNLCAAITLAAPGDLCGTLDGGAVVHCAASGTCVLDKLDAGADADAGTAKTGACIAAASDNGACDTAAGPACLPPARCVITTDGGTSGTCGLLDPANCH